MRARSARATEQAPREPLSTPQFFNQAGQAQQLSRLQQLFQQVIESEQALNHQCSRLVLGFHIVPLFGTADDHAKTLGRRIAADPDLAAGPALIAGKGGRPLMTFPVPLPMGYPLLRSEEHTSELQSLMRISYAVFCLKKKNKTAQRNIEQIRSYVTT